MEAGPEYDPSLIENIFQEFKGRRAGLIKALTTDVEEFFRQCDPEKDNLCLYGCPNGTWEVSLPAEEIPPEIPEPALGVNFARDGMTKPKWLTFVADRSDSWLLSVAFHSASRFSVCKSDRVRLFSMINDLPTVSETVRGSFEKLSKEKSSATTHKSDTRKSPSGSKRGSESDIRASRGRIRRGGGVEEQDDDRMCGICNKDYSTECEFWIFCHTCENWFHSECVNITQASVAEIKQYKCPSCCRRP